MTRQSFDHTTWQRGILLEQIVSALSTTKLINSIDHKKYIEKVKGKSRSDRAVAAQQDPFCRSSADILAWHRNWQHRHAVRVRATPVVSFRLQLQAHRLFMGKGVFR